MKQSISYHLLCNTLVSNLIMDIRETGMEDYKEDEDVIIGVNCVHMYHKDCLLKWMQAKHDFCPYCRCYVFPVSDFVTVAKDQLGEERFKELVEEDDPELVAMYIGSTGQSNDETPAAPKAGSTSA